MMKPIRTLGAAVVALAAPALFATSAAADPKDRAEVTLVSGKDAEAHYAPDKSYDEGHPRYQDHRYDEGGRYDHRYGGRRGFNEWGQTRWEVRELRRDAVWACEEALIDEALYAGFRRVSLSDDWRVRQVGRYRFEVQFEDVRFEGRRRDAFSDIFCEVRRGEVTYLDGIPRGPRGHGYGPPPRW